MTVKTFGVRDLRNSTSAVIQAVLDGHDVYISVNGTPQVRVVPLDDDVTPMAQVLVDAAALPRVASNSMDELLAAKERAKAAQAAR